jgi:hypothetical protein
MGENLSDDHRILNAMTRTAPPQAGQVSISIPNTRFSPCAQILVVRVIGASAIG